jgi:hypothetical protein
VTYQSCFNLAPNASSPIAANSSIGIITAGPYDIPCPEAQPIFVYGQCINCTAPTPNFNVTSQICSACPSGSVYTPSNQSCVVVPMYISNLSATTWVSATPFADFVQNGNAIATGKYIVCPTATPYYNGIQCISCNSQYPYFDM